MSGQSGLSQRESQTAQSYAGGQTYQSIADILCIAPSTARVHLAKIYQKLEVSSKLELASHLNGEALQPRNQSEMAAVVSELALSIEEAISREKALSEVLRSISAAQGELNAVMPLILTYALELCGAEFGTCLSQSLGEQQATERHGRAGPYQGTISAQSGQLWPPAHD